MNAADYLQSYGWRKGEALKHGGLKRPIQVKHKKDQKGLGHTHDNQEAWWERVFDGQLKALDVSTDRDSSQVSFVQKEIKVRAVSRYSSPLYKNFVRGGLLEGTIKKRDEVERVEEITIISRSSEGVNESNQSKKKKRKEEETGIGEGGEDTIEKHKEGLNDKMDKKVKEKKDKKDKKPKSKSKKRKIRSKKNDEESPSDASNRKRKSNKSGINKSREDWMRASVQKVKAEKMAAVA